MITLAVIFCTVPVSEQKLPIFACPAHRPEAIIRLADQRLTTVECLHTVTSGIISWSVPAKSSSAFANDLKLTYRDVEQASQEIAARRANDEFAIALSRLADIENKGTVPTIYRLYSLCAIYRLDAPEVLRWYGVPLELLPSESLNISLGRNPCCALFRRRSA